MPLIPNTGRRASRAPPWSLFLHHPLKIYPRAMLRTRALLRAQLLTRSYATASSPHALVFLEHNQGVIDPSSLSALTAATQLGGKVTGLIVGDPEQVNSVLEKAKKHVRLNGYLRQAQPTLHFPGSMVSVHSSTLLPRGTNTQSRR